MSEQGGPEEVDQAVERPQVRVRRIYEDPDPADGDRVLVDRLWPRGMSKVRAHLDEWCKQVAPSPELRRWYAHDPAKYPEFRRRYLEELRGPDHADALADHLRDLPRVARDHADRYDAWRSRVAPRDDGRAGERVVRRLRAEGRLRP